MTRYTDHWYPKGTLPEPFLPVVQDDSSYGFSVGYLMPPADKIPDEVLNIDYFNKTKWAKLFGDRFYGGLASLDLVPKEGIDKDVAWRHISTIMGSWDPKHEYKEAACIFLMGLWFDDATTWTVKERK